MRYVLRAGLCGLFIATVLGVTGCEESKQAKTPPSMMEVPKQGPVAAGSSGGGGNATGVVPGQKNAND